MNASPPSRPAVDAPEAAPGRVTLTEVERAIEAAGARYVSDLRALSEILSQFYEAQLADKEAQIADLGRRAEAAERERDARARQGDQLAQRLEALERERDQWEAQARELKATSAGYAADLRALGEELSRRAETLGHGPAARPARDERR